MSKRLIFLLTSDPAQGNFLKYHISSGGFKEVMLFQNHDECLYRIRRNAAPDFIIAETSLNSNTDIEFLKIIKTEVPRARIMFFSESDELSHMSVLLEAGAADYIQRNGTNANWIHELISNLQYLIREEYPVRTS